MSRSPASRFPISTPLTAQARVLARAVAQHEAGHYIVGRVLGFKTGALTIQLLNTGHGLGHKGEAEITLHEEISTIEAVQHYLERRVQVLYAGVLAEAMDMRTGEIDAETAIQHLGKGAAGDHAKAREAMQLIRNIKYGQAQSDEQVKSQLEEINGELWNKAGAIVIGERDLIEILSTRLAQLVKATGPAHALSKSEIDGLEAIAKRFGAPDEARG